jgi:hypothetical protein
MRPPEVGTIVETFPRDERYVLLAVHPYGEPDPATTEPTSYRLDWDCLDYPRKLATLWSPGQDLVQTIYEADEQITRVCIQLHHL